MSASCLEGVWTVSGRFLEGVWNVSGGSLEDSGDLKQSLSRKCLDIVRKILWKVSERCLEGVRRVSTVCLEYSDPQFFETQTLSNSMYFYIQIYAYRIL